MILLLLLLLLLIIINNNDNNNNNNIININKIINIINLFHHQETCQILLLMIKYFHSLLNYILLNIITHDCIIK